MPANRNALIRYKTIDTCLRNRYRQWTLEDLIDACSDALYEYEGIDKGISRRTIQMDIQMMRSEKLGYNAPIVVYDNKYYTYEDPDYSITNTPLSEQDLKVMSEAVEVLRQFKGFSYFSEMEEIVNRLEDHVTSVRQQTSPVIDFEKNEHLKGLNYLDTIYNAVVNKQALNMKYRSFTARSASSFIFYPYLLKEYRNRWFVLGVKKKNKKVLLNLALDRIHNLSIAENEPYHENGIFDPLTFFDDIVGVTKSIGSKPEKVRFQVQKPDAFYVLTKPIHKSQRLIEEKGGNMIFEIEVIINKGLVRDLFGFAEGIKILEPVSLANLIQKKLRATLDLYNPPHEEDKSNR